MVALFGKTYPKIVPVGGFQVCRLNLPLLSVQRFPGQVLSYHARTEPPVATALARLVEILASIAATETTTVHITCLNVFTALSSPRHSCQLNRMGGSRRSSEMIDSGKVFQCANNSLLRIVSLRSF